MPLACSRRHLGGSEPVHRARQFSQLFLGCIFKERPAQMEMEKPPAWFHWSFLFLVNLAALLCREAEMCHGVVVSKICCNAVIVLSVVLCDCCKPMNSCRGWAFSNSGLEVGLPAFQLPMFAKVTHCRKEICSTCLSKESMPFEPFVKSKPPLPTRSLSSRERHTLWLHHAHPFVAAAEKGRKNLFYAEKQRVWSRSYGLQDLLHAVIVRSVVLCYAANQWAVDEIELLATVGWKWGCQPFSCRCSKNVTHCSKKICPTCLSKESMPCVKIQASTPYPKLEFPRAAVRSPALHFVVVASCPSLRCSCRNKKQVEKTCLMQRSRGFGHWVMASKICCNAVIVLSVVPCDCCKPMNICRDWAFSNTVVGWKWGCQPFSCPCSQNVAQCQTRFGRHVRLRLRHQLPPFFLGIPSIHSLPEAGSWERQYVRQLCIVLALCLQKIPSLCRRFRICVICRKS